MVIAGVCMTIEQRSPYFFLATVMKLFSSKFGRCAMNVSGFQRSMVARVSRCISRPFFALSLRKTP